jgi:hypothetical protein
MGAPQKLREADYFLRRMRENSSDRDAFKYNLSAFLSAARSVRWFLRGKHENRPNFKQWWNSKREWVGLKKGENLRDIADPIRAANIFFDETRDITIHERSVQPRAHVRVEVTEWVNTKSSVEAVVIRADGTREKIVGNDSKPAPEPTDAQSRIEWRWYFEDLPPVVEAQDVVTLSEEHLDRLKALVSECESRFASS